MNNDSKYLLLTLFRLQNGHRKLSEFTDIGTYPDCYISELSFGVDRPGLKNWYIWFFFDGFECVCWDNTKIESIPFPILDHISFEDKI
jgi:hypothetical protein